MRTDKPRIELVIRAKDEISHEQARAITLAANLGASVSVYLQSEPKSKIWRVALYRAEYVEIAGRTVKDRSGQLSELDKSDKIINH